MSKNLASLIYDKMPKSADETEEGKKRLDSYYAALGRFAHRFALVEVAVHLVLKHYAKLPTDIARALLSGVRTDDTRNKLSRLHDVNIIDDKDWDDIEFIFDQIALILRCRNDIFHYGALSVAEGRGMVTNATTALTVDRITSFDVSDRILDDMTSDLRKILIHLHVRHMGRPALRGKHPEIDTILHATWRYKQPPSPPQKSRKPFAPMDAKQKARQDPPKP